MKMLKSMWAGLVTGLLIGMFIAAVHNKHYVHDLKKQIVTLNQACIPTDTGGGVTQCLQPSVTDLSITQCLKHPEDYIGVTTEDTLKLIGQCVDDYKDYLSTK